MAPLLDPMPPLGRVDRIVRSYAPLKPEFRPVFYFRVK
jgi:hypothetical protein